MGKRFVLENGLRVVLEEQHASKVAAFQVWVNAGSADEQPHEVGLAHLHEHMIFKGTGRRGLGEIAREIEERGGEINAWTSFDQTVYHVVLASQFAQVGLDVLADAVRNSAFDPSELAREIEVVCEEIRRSDDSPPRRASRDLFATAYRVHPYRRPVIGFQDTVRSFTRERVLDFYGRCYSPENIVLAAAGDFTEAQLRQWTGSLWNGQWGQPTSAPARPAEPPRTDRSIHVREDEAKEAYLNLAFAIPSVAHQDAPALDVLAAVLGQSDASRLVTELKRKQSLVNDIRAFAYTPRDPGLLVAAMTLPAEKIEEALQAAAELIFQLRSEPIPPDELATTQASIEAQAIYQRETVQGLARKLGFYESAAGGIEREEGYYDAIARLTADDLREVAEKYLRPQVAIANALVPVGTAFDEARVQEALDRASRRILGAITRRALSAEPPAVVVTTPIAARSDASGVIVERLPSGCTVVVREEAAAPLFAIRAAFNGGLRYETEQTNGISTLLCRTWIRGTQSRDAEDISHLVERLSGSLGAQAGRNSVSLRGEFLARHFDRAFALFADCLLNASFPEDELDRERRLQLQDVLAREDYPAGLTHDLFARTLYQLHPYRFSPLGEAGSVEQLSRSALREYHARHLDPSQMTLCVAGDVKADRVLGLARGLFGKPGRPAAPSPDMPEEAPPDKPRSAKHVLQRAQSHLILGFPGVRVTDPQRHALELLSTVLSGQGGRLFLELRDKRSLAYSVSSFAVEGVDPGYFAVYIATSPGKVEVALEAIRAELARARDALISPAELRRAQRHLIGTHEIGLQRNAARAALLALDHCYGIGLENFLHYADRIASVTAEQVEQVARRVIDFDRSALAVVGP